MRLQVWAVGLAAGILWGGAVLFGSVANLVWPPYAGMFLQFAASIYPGFHPGTGLGAVIVGTLWGLADGFVGGVLFAWLYNLFARGGRTAAS